MKRDLVVAVLTTFCLTAALFTIVPSAGSPFPPYNFWLDINDDGRVDMRDIGAVCSGFGAQGTPVTKSAIEYDTGWINITDKCGQYFNITHNLNNSDIMVNIVAKANEDGGVHQKYFGLTGFSSGWWKTYGGTGTSRSYCGIQTYDGGYALAGYTDSFGAGGSDGWLIKTDANGIVQWNATYGGPLNDGIYAMVQTTDGGFAFAGFTHGTGYDAWLVKTDTNGNVQWNKSFGGTGADNAYSVIQTYDGGYALVGGIYSMGAAGYDFWLIKTNSTGDMQWNRTYGGTGFDAAYSVVQTPDGGYVLGGAGFANLLKTDSDGNIQWSRNFGGEYIKSMTKTSDGGFALIGSQMLSGFWLIKTNSTGDMQWNRTYGTDSVGYSLIQTIDEGYALAGWKSPSDIWIVKIDGVGNMQWNITYQETSSIPVGPPAEYSLVQTKDGGYTFFGTRQYTSGADFWVIRTDFESGLAWTDSTADTITLYRGATDPYWNFVRIRIWKVKENP